jgi:hypothetical protein
MPEMAPRASSIQHDFGMIREIELCPR